MDIDLKLLGPYAGILQETVNSKEEKPKPGTSRRANFTALYKKQNLKFIEDPEARRQGRQKHMEEHRRGRRSLIIAKGRKPTITEMTNELNILIREDSSNEISELEESSPSMLSITPDEKMETSNSASTTNSDVLNRNNADLENSTEKVENGEGVIASQQGVSNKGVTSTKTINGNIRNASSKQNVNKKPSPPLQTIKDSRRDQLQKWKREKQAVDSKARLVQKQPFKVGAPLPPPPVKPVKSTSAASLVKSANSTANSSAAFGTLKSSTSVTGGINKTAPTVTRTTAKVNASGGVTSSSRQATGATGTRVAAAAGRGVPQSGASKTATKPVVLPPPESKPDAGVRRVTRAMSKTATVVAAAPPVQKMKTLNITGKASTTTKKPGDKAGSTTTGSKAPVVTKPGKPVNRTATNTSSTANGVSKKGTAAAQISSKNIGKDVKGHAYRADAKSSLIKEKSPSPNPLPRQPQEQVVVKKKKAKPKAIDVIYTDYNGRFSDACRKLGNYRTEWTNILEKETVGVPEDILDEIHSALGKVKLLLESKLPQFGQLLFAYLCKDEDETIILACDLEGWWDVAYIQVEKVYETFEALATIKRNQWRKSEPEPPKPVLKISDDETTSRKSSSFNPPQRRPYKPKAQASGGLKAFLANKRKMASSKSESDVIVATPTSNEPMDISSTSALTVLPAEPSTLKMKQPTELKTCPDQSLDYAEVDLNQSNRNFEGGFFRISSPLATPTTPRDRRRKHDSTLDPGMPPVSAIPSALRTPNRLNRLSNVSSSSDASLRRASLSMLGVRRSMGTFSRIGVVSVFTDET